MSTLKWSLPARQDLDGIYDFICEDGRPLTADKVVSKLYEKCETYANAFASGSTVGTLRTDLGKEVRVFSHSRWVIVFRPVEYGIEILRVVDASRDFQRLFGDLPQ